MKKPWSISTTVRNPERLRNFLMVLRKLEGQTFNKENQVKYQTLLIQEKLYKPLYIPQRFKEYNDNPELVIPYEVAEEVFRAQKYEDPPMRGRQSANPLSKLGFAIAREGAGVVRITRLGQRFLAGDYDIGFVFFKSLLKLQFPNPWSADFSEKDGFNIMPFVATMHLIHKVNQKSDQQGLDKAEFSIFVPTLINVTQIEEHVDRILEYRKERDKEKYIHRFAQNFYAVKSLPPKKVNNLFDYGDNIIRYFRLTRYFRVTVDHLGYYWKVDLEPSRMIEIKQLMSMYDGAAVEFKDTRDYVNYLSDIKKPQLPWERINNLRKIALSLTDILVQMINKDVVEVSKEERQFLETDVARLERGELESYIPEVRRLHLGLKERLKRAEIRGNIEKIQETINILRDSRRLRSYEPEQFEKLITEALQALNDEILIKANYPVDDNGEPISHAPGNKADVECYYASFKGICEVTLNTSRLQWVQEGQPVMRHLRDFELEHSGEDVFCVFVAPRVHRDTYSQFWISVKYEYDGSPQRIVPMTTEQFADILETLLQIVRQGNTFSHRELYSLYNEITYATKKLDRFSDWAAYIGKAITGWQRRIISA